MKPSKTIQRTALILALLASAPSSAQLTLQAPALGALPAQAPVQSFTPLAARGRALDALPGPAATPTQTLAERVTPPAQKWAEKPARIEHMLFDRRPVAVSLRVDRERLLRLPFAAMLDIPPALGAVLEAQIIENTVYLTALMPIERERVLAHALDGSGVIPLDLSANGEADPRPELAVHLPGAEGAAATASDAPPPDMVQLTRHAAQAIYAPRRLIKPLPGVRQAPVSRKPVHLYRDLGVTTAPLGAWTSGELFVTAVRFTNAGARPVELDMERLRGRWLAATPQHWRLHARGSEADTMVVYLVSEQAFDAIRQE